MQIVPNAEIQQMIPNFWVLEPDQSTVFSLADYTPTIFKMIYAWFMPPASLTFAPSTKSSISELQTLRDAQVTETGKTYLFAPNANTIFRCGKGSEELKSLPIKNFGVALAGGSCDKEGLYTGDAVFSYINSQSSAVKATFEKSNLIEVTGKKIRDYMGAILEGQFAYGGLNGLGKTTYHSGITEKGQYKNGRLNGLGKITFPAKVTEEGQILPEYIQEGEFKDGFLNGQGKITSSDQFIIEGQFKNSRLDGQGKETYSDGLITEGQFINGLLDGQGKVTRFDVVLAEGQFKNGLLINGQKKITLPDGVIKEGQIKNGVLVKFLD